MSIERLDGNREYGIRSQLIMCFVRDWSAEFAMATLPSTRVAPGRNHERYQSMLSAYAAAEAPGV